MSYVGTVKVHQAEMRDSLDQAIVYLTLITLLIMVVYGCLLSNEVYDLN